MMVDAHPVNAVTGVPIKRSTSDQRALHALEVSAFRPRTLTGMGSVENRMQARRAALMYQVLRAERIKARMAHEMDQMRYRGFEGLGDNGDTYTPVEDVTTVAPTDTSDVAGVSWSDIFKDAAATGISTASKIFTNQSLLQPGTLVQTSRDPRTGQVTQTLVRQTPGLPVPYAGAGFSSTSGISSGILIAAVLGIGAIFLLRK